MIVKMIWKITSNKRRQQKYVYAAFTESIDYKTYLIDNIRNDNVNFPDYAQIHKHELLFILCLFQFISSNID